MTELNKLSVCTFLSSGLIWAMSILMLSVFHAQEWLVKYSRTIMALWRRVIVFIILKVGRPGGQDIRYMEGVGQEAKQNGEQHNAVEQRGMQCNKATDCCYGTGEERSQWRGLVKWIEE